jgi:hypothetical protein
MGESATVKAKANETFSQKAAHDIFHERLLNIASNQLLR